MRATEEYLNQQASLLAGLSAENERLSNVVARAQSSELLSQAELPELLRLRNGVAKLQETIRQMDQLRRNIGRLHDRLQDAAAEEEYARENDKALLADELALRQARVARLKRWLEGMPQEQIPELQFLPEDQWISKVDSPLITDEDYGDVIGLLRAHGELAFASMTRSALKQYAQANNGQFPTDLSQLQPFFQSPVDDAILQRYEIVPANSLVPPLASAGGDWVITQTAPVNKAFDIRVAIGLKGTSAVGGGLNPWDPVP